MFVAIVSLYFNFWLLHTYCIATSEYMANHEYRATYIGVSDGLNLCGKVSRFSLKLQNTGNFHPVKHTPIHCGYICTINLTTR